LPSSYCCEDSRYNVYSSGLAYIQVDTIIYRFTYSFQLCSRSRTTGYEPGDAHLNKKLISNTSCHSNSKSKPSISVEFFLTGTDKYCWYLHPVVGIRYIVTPFFPQIATITKSVGHVNLLQIEQFKILGRYKSSLCQYSLRTQCVIITASESYSREQTFSPCPRSSHYKHYNDGRNCYVQIGKDNHIEQTEAKRISFMGGTKCLAIGLGTADG
jgi:hypothetical protein